jgi:hypothetical protein
MIEKVLLAVGIIILMGIFYALPLMWLWNWIMPTVFGLTKIGFWQALGIRLLASTLFHSSTTSKTSE